MLDITGLFTFEITEYLVHIWKYHSFLSSLEFSIIDHSFKSAQRQIFLGEAFHRLPVLGHHLEEVRPGLV